MAAGCSLQPPPSLPVFYLAFPLAAFASSLILILHYMQILRS